ncbi:latent-transforming growth factor beta-binding protein 2-like isoform X3 [Etheostoma cragini]|uniref:latent-transforming growth factor beta-binding protein 2-like isoform X3 n=1 Tax=Etheostoma cragini TaxID=417921 RepID=UPI00155EC4B7|nr:latent-transforming growth factor beta-binding protein 2-like isoform X3 [Etheostoma cragini]
MPKMDRAGFAVLMVLTVALGRIGDCHKDTTGGRKEGAGTGRTVWNQQQSRVRSQGHLPGGPEDGASSEHSEETSPGTSQSRNLVRLPRGTTSQADDSHKSKAEPDHAAGASQEDLVSAPLDGALRTARHPGSQKQSIRVNRRQSSKPSSASTRKLLGPNVCGGQQCCSGWALAPGTNRCIKPDCQPPCQNRGSCSRPQICVCRSGFQGPRCEEVAPEQVYIRDGGALRRVQPGANPFQKDKPRRRPSERQAIDTAKAQTPRPATTRQPVTQVRRGPSDSFPQQTGTSRTVKRYPSSSGPITSNSLPSSNGYANVHSTEHRNWHGHKNGHSNGHSFNTHRPTSDSQPHGQFNNALLPAGANLTSNLDRIKIIFTPMLCRRVCSGGRCYNSCEKGDITTVYSETSHQLQQQQQPKNHGFRLFFCQIPCLNGGRCIGRDLCWCPSNSTGKFCHLPAPPPARPTPHSHKDASHQGPKSPSQSMYTLPLSNQQVSLHPSLVNVHIQHPPDADVQIHQVARVQPGQRPATTDGAHSVQQRSQPGNGHEPTTEHSSSHPHTNGNGNGHGQPHNRQNGHVGRCFQETVDGKCGKPLPGLTKQDDCCGSVGTSWGLNKCQKCPTKPAYAVIANGQVECSEGFKRMNLTHCQDINECLLPGLCKNAECLNTKGSYRCTCKPGFMLDADRSHCVSDKAVSDQKAFCYRSVSASACSLPLAQHITKQICCCSRVGKAWGPLCDRCPLPGSDHFKEICPAGHGYTYSRSDVQISLRQLEEDDLQSTGVSWEKQSPTFPQPPSIQPWLLLPSRPQYPIYPQTPQVPQYPEYPETPQGPGYPLTPQQPLHPFHPARETPTHSEDVDILSLPAVVTDSPLKYPETSPDSSINRPDSKDITRTDSVTGIDKCAITPSICGRGKCIPVQTGYTCHCEPGFKLNALQTNCIDVNECDEDPCEGKGRCMNNYGSYTCQCHSGYSQVITQNRKFCQDINECSMPNKCQNGECINTEGSYTCECNSGFAKSWRGQCEDVDECRDPGSCPNGVCVNTPGSFQCQTCSLGFRPVNERCVDVNECLNQTVCGPGRCVNTEGSYRCNCFQGYKLSSEHVCQDVDECVLPGVCLHGRCVNLDGTHKCTCNHGYQVTSDSKTCEDVNECATGNVCPAGICMNSAGSYTCRNCRPGFGPSADGLRCEDVNECAQDDLCLGGVCANTEGSYSCTRCKAGYKVSQDRQRCEDVDECQSLFTCANGICLNSEGSYTCENCPTGYRVSHDGEFCEDIDECVLPTTCPKGTCTNTEGSFTCTVCQPGFKVSEDGQQCDDVDECLVANVCQAQLCLNNPGSYTCRNCGAGLQLSEDGSSCEDIDECVNETICGNHGFCENTDGSYLCQCDQGYTNLPGDMSKCVDVNECEMSLALCGEALCENFDGSFLCICPNDNEEFDPITSQCRSLADIDPTPAARVPLSAPSAEERKECYYNLNDANFCDNVLSRNTTKQECCCTVGAGWGDNCEIHACPLPGRADYNQLCPHGSGLLPLPDASIQSLGEQRPYIDANECEMFGSDICKNGQCENLFSTYTCYCRSGFYYDNIRLECVDYDECSFGIACEDGACVNTAGSFNCFCSPPLVLDSTRRRCIGLNTTEETQEPDNDVHMDICWQHLEGYNMCSEPLQGRRTTYTECCCLYGIAWSGQCAFCPQKNSDDYAVMCNLPRRDDTDSLRERPGHEYGLEGPEDPAEPFVPPYWDNYGSPAGPYDIPEGFNDNDYSVQQPPFRVPISRPRQQQPRPVDSYVERYDGFEGLRAEECGILNGCENGRCVRVREGYTCDCFDGYELDLNKMACIDINECEDISDKVPLCHNGQCTNTEGSYKCTCLPGFVASAEPHKCIPEIPASGLVETGN